MGKMGKMAKGIEEKGNPDFNIAAITPSETIGVSKDASSYTDEDRLLDLELERLAAENPPLKVSDHDVTPEVKREITHDELLSEHVENYKPASTINEIMDQVHQAKLFDCDSIYATPEIVKYYTRKDYDHTVKAGYFMFHDIKVYLEGHFERARTRDTRTTLDKDKTMNLNFTPMVATKNL
jgi:hypothetical protein